MVANFENVCPKPTVSRKYVFFVKLYNIFNFTFIYWNVLKLKLKLHDFY